MGISEADSGLLPTSKVQLFVMIVNDKQYLFDWYVFVVQGLRYKVNKYVRLLRLMIKRFSMDSFKVEGKS